MLEVLLTKNNVFLLAKINGTLNAKAELKQNKKNQSANYSVILLDTK